jgi:hypothetical protein
MTQAITDDSPILRNNKRQRSQGITRESLPNLSEDSRSPSVSAYQTQGKKLLTTAQQGAGSPTSKCDKGVRAFVVEHRDSLYQLYATSVEAKIWGVCAMGLNRVR